MKRPNSIKSELTDILKATNSIIMWKRTVLRVFLLVLIGSGDSNAQHFAVEINRSFIERDNEYHKLFSSYYNKVVIMVNQKDCRSLRLAGDFYDVKQAKNDSCSFYIRPLSTLPRPIYIFENSNKIGSLKFYIDSKIPLPRLERSGKQGENGSISKRLDSLYCVPNMPGKFNDSLYFKILSFVAEFRIDDNIYSEHIIGNLFSNTAKKVFQKIKPNDELVIKSAVIQDDLGNIYIIPEKKFTVW